MVNKCCAVGCRNGYDKNAQEGISFHTFPNEDFYKTAWLRRLKRDQFEPTKYSRLCSEHFTENDFITERQDSKISRKRKCTSDLQKRRLKQDAIPSRFPNNPAYLSHENPAPRSTERATSEGRFRHEQRNLDDLQKSSIDADKVHTVTDLRDRFLESSHKPSGFVDLSSDSNGCFGYISYVPYPQVSCSLSVDLNMVVKIHLGEKSIPSSQYTHLCPRKKIEIFSQFLNVLSFLKSLLDDNKSADWISIATESLENYCNENAHDRKSAVILEQLKLSLKNKFTRSYSPELIMLAYLLYATSASAYRTLLEQDVLCLPSVVTLQKITCKMGSSVSNHSYLNLRFSQLDQIHRNVVLLIDEIYIAKRVEYSRGDIIGLTSDNEVASTLLCFMIRSCAGNYKDIVGIYPMSNITAVKQHSCYLDIMQLVHSVGFNVVAISVDNATVNRKFFKEILCGGSLSSHSLNPLTDQPLFLLFDPVHNIKNVYNNFQAKKLMKCPPHLPLLPNGCIANFHHIEELYNLESSKSLRKAHKLTATVINPKSIEKTSVKLSLAVFCESTLNALRFYAAHENKPWSGTADFIELILKQWSIMNVKSSLKGKHKRDIYQDPVRSSLDWKLCCLNEFNDLLSFWQSSSDYGFTRETFLALKQTSSALADCTAYLLDKLEFSFVLLGKLQSDSIESRFSWFRQLSGANYYISMRQVLESDRKIRAISLMRFSSISIADLEDDFTSSRILDSLPVAEEIVKYLTLQYEPTSSDANVIYYVCGALARSCIRVFRCESCRSILLLTDKGEPLEIDDDLDYSAKSFLNEVNRGGLVQPSYVIFLVGIHCWKVYEDIKTENSIKSKFLSFNNHRSLFSKLINMTSSDIFAEIFCSNNHDVKNTFVNKFFNCLAKNLVKDLSTPALLSSSKTQRKITKLSSTKN